MGISMGLSENVGYIPNEIAIFHRDNDQQNHWVKRGLAYFQTNPDVVLDCSSFSGPGSCWVDVGGPLPRRRVHAWLLPPWLQWHKPLPARSHRFSPTRTKRENDGK